MSSADEPVDSAMASLRGDSPQIASASGIDEVTLSSQWGARQAVPSHTLESEAYPPQVRRRVRLPVILFLLTMASTFIAGATGWVPHYYVLGDAVELRLSILKHWDNGLIYMACVLAMLLAHEMGHFLATVFYRIPASFPYFLPLPITPIGTLGAVIRMDHRDADRKQMFDIGIAGPLAGLVVAVPLLYVGLQKLDFKAPLPPDALPSHYGFKLGAPIGLQLMMRSVSPPGYEGQPDEEKREIDIRRVNPYLMAGWVGLLVTALNMMPVSQLDGGHIVYTLFGKPAHWIARGFMVLTIAYMVYSGSYQLSLMIGIILLIGIDHPPTSNDEAPIGWFRYGLGIASLIIPVLCLTLEPIIQR